MPDICERMSTSCTKDLIGRISESFTGSKEEEVEAEEVEAVDKDYVCVLWIRESETIVHLHGATKTVVYRARDRASS